MIQDCHILTRNSGKIALSFTAAMRCNFSATEITLSCATKIPCPNWPLDGLRQLKEGKNAIRIFKDQRILYTNDRTCHEIRPTLQCSPFYFKQARQSHSVNYHRVIFGFYSVVYNKCYSELLPFRQSVHA